VIHVTETVAAMMTSISPALTPSVSLTPLNKPAAAASQDELTAARLAKAQELGTSFEDPSLGGVIVTLSSDKEPKIDPYGELRIAQKETAGRAMETIKKELGKIDALIAKRRPELAGAWDFQLVDGKFKVTGLNADDAKWLERRLNADTTLKNAAESFVSTAADDFEVSASNPQRGEYNYVSGKIENYSFSNVKAQLAEKLSFKSLLTQADQIADSNRISLATIHRGETGLNVVAHMLTPSNQPIEGRAGPFYTTQYAPLQS
jgi:hypothetical protein